MPTSQIMQLKDPPPSGLFKNFPQKTHFEILYGLDFEPCGLDKEGKTLFIFIAARCTMPDILSQLC